jgi:hypothetical protein
MYTSSWNDAASANKDQTQDESRSSWSSSQPGDPDTIEVANQAGPISQFYNRTLGHTTYTGYHVGTPYDGHTYIPGTGENSLAPQDYTQSGLHASEMAHVEGGRSVVVLPNAGRYSGNALDQP